MAHFAFTKQLRDHQYYETNGEALLAFTPAKKEIQLRSSVKLINKEAEIPTDPIMFVPNNSSTRGNNKRSIQLQCHVNCCSNSFLNAIKHAAHCHNK